jgi:hypothetical protein
MKKSVLALSTALGLALAALAAVPAHAMGSGNNYVDHQVGVTYTVYQPTYTNGLKQTSFGSMTPDAQCSAELALDASYGGSKGRRFSITEGNPICRDIGNGPTVLKTTIKGARAVIEAYCPEPTNSCSAKDVAKWGGHLSVIFPSGGKGLRPTKIWIETLKGHAIGANELVKIAQRMQPVG